MNLPNRQPYDTLPHQTAGSSGTITISEVYYALNIALVAATLNDPE